MKRLLLRLSRWRKWHRWVASLTPGERARLHYWGATGNPKHHPDSYLRDGS